MKKFLILIFIVVIVFFVSGFFIVSSVVIGATSTSKAQSTDYKTLEITNGIKNNYLYAERYRKLVEKHLKTDGYVTLERLVYYLQRTKNVLDITTLSENDWEIAYMENIDEEAKQMLSLKTICINLKNKDLPKYTIESGKNADGKDIDKLDLCNVNGIDVVTSSDYSEALVDLPYTSPLDKNINYSLTSMVFEQREVDVNVSSSMQQHINYHNGWDLAVPIGTEVKSICDGTITAIIMTQNNDLIFNISGNLRGNYVYVECTNGYIAQYLHIKYNSVYGNKKEGNTVRKGELLLQSSTTGISTGPHLHLGLKTKDGEQLDAFSYIDFAN